MNAQDFTLVVGSGSMACLFAACLARSGQPVMMLGDWEEGVKAVQDHGVQFIGSLGEESRFSVPATTDPGECLGARVALVLVKSWQTAAAAGQLKTCLHPQGVALTLQNGLGNYEILAAVLGKERAAAGITTLGAYMLRPGVIHPELGGEVILGEGPGLAEIQPRLQRAGLRVSAIAGLSSLQWGKLVVNSAVNPLSLLIEAPNIELLTNPHSCALMHLVACETAAVAAAAGIRLPYSDPAAHVDEVIRRTPDNQTSMLQDYRRGAETEIEAINGAVIRCAEQNHVPAPYNLAMLHLVKAKLLRIKK